MLPKAPRQPARKWRGLARGALLMSGLWLAGIHPALADDTITSAKFIDPTTRYAHGVLGDDIEYGGLELTVRTKGTNQGTSVLTVRLPQDRVFEDLTPRLVDITKDGSPEAIVVESQADTGAQLAIYDASGTKIAATPHIGTRNRWLAPVGAADLDGDGHVEIAYIDRPHLAKTLRIWRFENGDLTEITAIPGLTNHQIGEDFISGGLRRCSARATLVVASADWSRVIGVFFKDGWKTNDLGPLKNRKDLSAALNC